MVKQHLTNNWADVTCICVKAHDLGGVIYKGGLVNQSIRHVQGCLEHIIPQYKQQVRSQWSLKQPLQPSSTGWLV